MKRGFTLIELLVVIAIIGILASIVLVSLNGARAKGVSARVQAETSQIRSAFEQDYVGTAYPALAGSATHADTLVSTASNYGDLVTLFCDIGNQTGNLTSATGDVTLTCGGVANVHSGIVVYSNDVAGSPHDYGIYAPLKPSGYFCLDSFGKSHTSSGSIPTFASLTSPTTALCQ